MINLDAISKTEVTREPFGFFATSGVLQDQDLESIRVDFPRIEKPGIFPLSALEYEPAFAKLIDEIRSPELAELMGEKFAVDLTGLPLMITVRGRAQAKDGRIHTDTKDKVVNLPPLSERQMGRGRWRAATAAQARRPRGLRRGNPSKRRVRRVEGRPELLARP